MKKILVLLCFICAPAFGQLTAIITNNSPNLTLLVSGNAGTLTNYSATNLVTSTGAAGNVLTATGNGLVNWSNAPAGSGGSGYQTFTNILAFGADSTGVNDSWPALSNAMYNAYNTSNGITIYFPHGTYLFNEMIVMPSNSVIQRAPTICFIGDGAGAGEYNGYLNNVSAATTLLLRATNVAKILCEWPGRFQMQNINLRDDVDGTSPFIYSTMTTLDISHCSFLGQHGLANGPQDAIVLGGPSSSNTGGTTNSAFSGYGTTITQCMFDNIAHALWARTYANSVIFEQNTIAPDNSGTEAIKMDGYSGWNAGILIKDNIFELQNYTNLYLITNSSGTIHSEGNSIWDMPTGQSPYNIAGNSTYNWFHDVEASGCTNDWVGAGKANNWAVGYKYANVGSPGTNDPSGFSAQANYFPFGTALVNTSGNPELIVGVQGNSGYYYTEFLNNGSDMQIVSPRTLDIQSTAGNLTLNASGTTIVSNNATFKGNLTVAGLISTNGTGISFSQPVWTNSAFTHGFILEVTNGIIVGNPAF